jgi:leucyl aminopeptidase (aminopeptidase T)
MPNNEKIKFGAYQAIVNCIKLKPGEQLCIVSDHVTKHIADLFVEEALKITPKVKVFIMEDYGARPPDGSDPLKFPAEIGEYLKGSQASIYAADRFKGELESFRNPMLRLIESLGHVRHAHMPAIKDELMETGMNADYSVVQALCKKLHALLTPARHVKVTTRLGTDLELDLDPAWKWMIDDGNIRTENWSNLPAGEIYTCVKNADGTAVIDGVMGDYFAGRYGLLEKNPVTIVIKDDRITSFKCSNDALVKDLVEFSRQDENANRLGELGIGTNIALEKLTGTLVQDEKFPGVHIAMGHGYPRFTGSDWDSKAHLDMVMKETTIVVDGRTIMKDGKFMV